MIRSSLNPLRQSVLHLDNGRTNFNWYKLWGVGHYDLIELRNIQIGESGAFAAGLRAKMGFDGSLVSWCTASSAPFDSTRNQHWLRVRKHVGAVSRRDERDRLGRVIRQSC